MTKYKGYTTVELLVMDVGTEYGHDPELETELCYRAGLLEELRAFDNEAYKNVLNRAVKILSDREGIRTFSFWAGL